jgi:hypothetical protein
MQTVHKHTIVPKGWGLKGQNGVKNIHIKYFKGKSSCVQIHQSSPLNQAVNDLVSQT